MNNGYSQQRNKKADQIDLNDAIFIAERTKLPVIDSIPAPVTKYQDGPYVGMDKINPHVSRFYLGTRTVFRNGWRPRKEYVYTDVYHVKPIYYLNINGGWRPMSEVASHYGNKNLLLKEDWSLSMDMRYLSWLIKRMELLGGKILIPSPFQEGMRIQLTDKLGEMGKAVIHFTTTTFYPDPNPETTSVDGRVSRNTGSNDSWSTLRGATTATSVDDSTASMYWVQLNGYSSTGWQDLSRSVYLFDTSALTAGATISSAIMSVYCVTKNDDSNTHNQTIEVVQSNPASNTSLATGDWNTSTRWTMTRQATGISHSSITNGAYNDFTFNGTGLGNISKTAVSKFGIVLSGDADNTEPTKDASHQTLYTGYFSEQTGTSNDPKLAVTYTTTTTYNQSVTATTAVTGKVTKGLSKTLIATSAISSSVLKQLTRSIVATTAVTGRVLKQMSKTLIGTTAVTASMVATKVYLQALTATTAITASITKIPGKLLSASTAVSASIAKVSMLARTLTATTVVTGAITKGLSKTLAATTAVTTSITKTPNLVLRATTHVTASISNTLAKVLVATTHVTATLIAGRTVIMTATVTTTATIGKTVGKLLKVTTSITAKILAPFWRTKYPSHGDEDDYQIKYPHD